MKIRKAYLMASVAAVGTCCLSAALVFAVAAGAPALADPTDPVNPLQNRFMVGKALDVCDMGGMFVGGVPKVTTYASSANSEGVPEQLTIGQMYVQFVIPTKHRQWPLIMVHGSGYTGAALDATPDGRMGWMAYAVQNNLSTFVVDQSGRGRSGFDKSVFHEAAVTGDPSLIPTLGGGSNNAIWTSWFGHLINGSSIVDGTLIQHGDSGDPDPAAPEPGPAHASGAAGAPVYPIPPVDSSVDANIEARVGAIGPAPNPANNTFLALNTYKQVVPNTEATLPGSTCPVCVPPAQPASRTWTPLALAELVETLGGAIVAGHSQASSEVLAMMRILKEHGNLDLLKGIMFPEGFTLLARAGLEPEDFDHVPMLVANGDYRSQAARDSNYAARDAINASPTNVTPMEVIDLDDPSFGGEFNGTTHMNMLGTNQIDVFDVMLKWAEDNIPNPMSAHACPNGPKEDPNS